MIRLVSLGVITEVLPQQYALTPIGVLRRDVPGSMREWLIAETDRSKGALP